jgi:transcriptional regulator with XRE-family HTH domain
MLTVAIRGHFAERMRGLAESHGMSLSKLLRDAILAYERDIAAGYEPGASLADWTAQQRDQAAEA